MASLVKKHWPLIIGLAVFWGTIAILLTLSVKQNQGHLVYGLDDPYIHMAIAKNFAQHGVWGINKEGFTSSSSSPLWTLVISLIYFLLGRSEVSPFVLNCIFGTLLILSAYFLFRKYGIGLLFVCLGLLAITFLTPLPALIFFGQEHIMHALITILFVYFSAKILSDEKSSKKRYILWSILAALVTMARYEGLFLILVVSVLLLLRRKPILSLGLGGAGLLPIIIYGVISISNGWYFLPNPILLKGQVPRFSSLSGIINFFSHSVDNLYNQMKSAPDMQILILGALIIFLFQYSKQKGIWRDTRIMMVIFITGALLHMQFAKTGWYNRYEAYLVALGLFVMVIGMGDLLSRKLSFAVRRSLMLKYIAEALIILIILVSFDSRAIKSLKSTPQATTNIYEQQYQMGLFLKEFYQGKSVAANDIGAINYLADFECLDLWGLGNYEITELLRKGRYDRLQISNLARQKNVRIAIIYESWFKGCGGIPSQWNKVGAWKIYNNLVCGDNTVSFYAVDPSEEYSLNKNLRAFSSRLPKNVEQVVKKLSYDTQ
ncbi:MAG: hypothetical protein AMJ92_10050 [candidate division Zixibacteria bacterium SM23_81]|nr:MAG: hypothetical protein AMJ92_10050 [candidate division Zixibacteria bacterium SM23_81]